MRRLDTAVQVATIIEAGVVVLSALFIAAELRSQSRQLEAQTAINATQLGSQRIYELQATPDMDRVVQQGFRDFASLDAFDQLRFRRYLLNNLFQGEDFYYQHASGLMGDATWENWKRGIARYREELNEPQWEGWSRYFSRDYARFLETLRPQPFVGF